MNYTVSLPVSNNSFVTSHASIYTVFIYMQGYNHYQKDQLSILMRHARKTIITIAKQMKQSGVNLFQLRPRFPAEHHLLPQMWQAVDLPCRPEDLYSCLNLHQFYLHLVETPLMHFQHHRRLYIHRGW